MDCAGPLQRPFKWNELNVIFCVPDLSPSTNRERSFSNLMSWLGLRAKGSNWESCRSVLSLKLSVFLHLLRTDSFWVKTEPMGLPKMSNPSVVMEISDGRKQTDIDSEAPAATNKRDLALLRCSPQAYQSSPMIYRAFLRGDPQ